MPEEPKTTETPDSKGEGNYLGSWSTREDAEAGLSNLQTKLSEQGGEVSTLRAENDDFAARMDEMQASLDASKSAGEQAAQNKELEGIQSEQANINKQIKDLDPVEEGYTPKLMALISKSNSITAKEQQQKTLEAATNAFRSELDQRDIRSAHNAFDSANPDFKTPEMQQRIKQYIANDKTGMSDALVAYREIQRDDVSAKAKELSIQNEELMKRLNLKKGTDETGTVIMKDQGGLESKPKTKTFGADRDAGMQAALDKLRAQ